MNAAARPIMFACGALARDVRAVLRSSNLDSAIEVQYLPANLHNRPERIVPELRPLIEAAVAAKRPVFIGYADCGTGGLLDQMLGEFSGVQRLRGAHCYELFAGTDAFAALQAAEPGTFYLTDYLALHFDALVWTGLGLDRHPQLLQQYFGNYTRVVHLRQDANNESAANCAQRAGQHLELPVETIITQRRELSVQIEASHVAA